ncbi:MAG: ABC transporter substrate-binding protein [Parvibaculaceae bacterium]
MASVALLLCGALSAGATLLAPPVAAAEPIKIGVSTVLSGQVALIGQQTKEGAELRVEEINAGGGILGRQLSLTFADNACDPAQGMNAAASLINGDKVAALIGTSCSSVTLATMPIIQRSNVVQLEYLATNPRIAAQSGAGGNKWQFRLNIDDSIMIRELSGAIAKEVKTVAIIAQNDDYGRGAAKAFGEQLSPQGIEILSTDFTTTGTVDYRPLITKIQALNPEGLIVILDAPNAAPLALQTAELGFAPKVYGRGTVVTPQFQSIVKNKDIWNGALEANRWVANPDAQKFAADYTKRFGYPPELNAAMAYYAVEVLADAIKRAGSDERGAIRDALEKTDLTISGLGPVKFDQNNQAHPDMFVIQWKDGEIVLRDRKPTQH